MRYRETLTVPITLDRGGPAPLHEQIAGQLVAAVRSGALAPGGRLPSTRTVAAALGVSRGVAASAYDVLAARGQVEARGGSGTYVAGDAAAPRPAATPATPGGGVVDFTPWRPCRELFPLAAWRAAWRQASCRMPALDAPPALGLPQLRTAIAGHVRRTRGLALAGQEVVVTRGALPGLRLVLDAIGHAPAGTGGSGGMVIEMVRDAVFGRPARTGGPTVLVGGFCEVLTPALGLGYAVVPRELVPVLERLVRERAEHAPYLPQVALAQLLADGTVLRLMHRRDSAYRRKRALVVGALLPLRPSVTLHGLDAAGTAVLRLAAGTAHGARRSLAERGIRLVASAEDRLLLGYGHLPDGELRRGLDALVAALRELGGTAYHRAA